MATLLQEAIESIRSAKRVLALATLEPESRAFYEDRIKQDWDNIQLYRSNKSMNVFVVDGIWDWPMVYRDLKDLEDDLLEINDVVEDGLELTFTLRKMTGREFGRLEFYEE
jgi:hypothetical protein